MNNEDLVYFREWFGQFCRMHYLQDCREQMNIVLKEKHSGNVAENALLIARGESFEANGLLLAETVGLFHDVGRFPQYVKFKTFRDASSVNHGVLGADTLKEQGVLDRLSDNERTVVLTAVRFHNALEVPDTEDDYSRQFIRIVRDADKLDIWQVFSDYYEGGEEAGADAVPLGLPDLPEYSGEILESIMQGKIARLASAKTLTDMKLLHLSWVFDINFRASFRLADERGSIGRMAMALPQTDDVLRAVSFVDKYVKERAAGG